MRFAVFRLAHRDVTAQDIPTDCIASNNVSTYRTTGLDVRWCSAGYLRRNRNSVPIAAMAWLFSTWLARAKTTVSSTWI